MKTIFMLLLTLTMTAAVARGQTIPRNILITGAEYFINADPGEGNGSPLAVTQGTMTDFQIPNATMQTGDWIHVRVKNERNVWSKPMAWQYKGYAPQRGQTVIKAEYFVNSDPGSGSANSIAIGEGNPLDFQPKGILMQSPW